VRATTASFCPQCLAVADQEYEVRIARPEVLWSRCNACARASVWRSGLLEFPSTGASLAAPRLPASVYFELARAAAGERSAGADAVRQRAAVRDAELMLATTATFIARYIGYELEEEQTTMTNESVLDRAMRDQRETQERIEALRQQIAQEELHMAEADAFVSMYRRYAGMADGVPVPRS
jgi:hypothetical protein